MKNIVNFRSSRTRMILLSMVDVFTIVIHSYVALLLRYELQHSRIEQIYLENILHYMMINVVITILIFIVMNLYRSVWSFAGLHEVLLIVGACGLSTAFQALGMLMFAFTMPRSYYVLYFFLLVMTTSVTRFSYRVLNMFRRGPMTSSTRAKIVRTMVVGAGEAGSMILKELKSSKTLNRKAICVIDDNPSKRGKYIHGIRIAGTREDIVKSVEMYKIEEIIFAIPSVSAKTLSDILHICNDTPCQLRVLPGMYQLLTEEVSVSKLRNVSIEDLLGRESIQIDLDSVSEYVRNKVILVTGAGGSIGSELCRQIATYMPKELVLVDIYENGVYEIQQELLRSNPALRLTVLIGSVRNTGRMESIMKSYRPDVVYHAAAHKHVPLMEDSPAEAIKNNVFGTYKVARAAGRQGVKKFVLISTDKAVNPTNIMGASKRICEMIVQMFNNHYSTEYVAVRFGNVLGSSGSVIPLFKKQIEEGGPVTVTHKDVIRYFMTIPEAVSLVMQAGAYAQGGEIFVLDMGEPVKIYNLAKNLIRLSGYTLGVDMDIKIVGLRPGEKLYEELLISEEGMAKTKSKLIFIGKPLVFDEKHFLSELEKLEKIIISESGDIKSAVSEIVPSYHIKKEDKERDLEIHKRISQVGIVSQEEAVVEEENGKEKD
jgi:Predicted nucleoside-diphosphate sugar epimerases